MSGDGLDVGWVGGAGEGLALSGPGRCRKRLERQTEVLAEAAWTGHWALPAAQLLGTLSASHLCTLKGPA